jgi:hypothetical protein
MSKLRRPVRSNRSFATFSVQGQVTFLQFDIFSYCCSLPTTALHNVHLTVDILSRQVITVFVTRKMLLVSFAT